MFIVRGDYLLTTPIGQSDTQTPQVQAGSNQRTNGQNSSKEAEREYLETLKLSEQRLQQLDLRISGTDRSIESTQKELDRLTGLSRLFSRGTRLGMQQNIEANMRYREQLVEQRQKMTDPIAQAKMFAEKGDFGRAKAILEGREKEYKEQMLKASKEARDGLGKAAQQLSESDKSLARTEAVLKTAQRGTVIAAAVVATAATAGAGAPLLLTAAAGTAAGTGMGAVTNFTEAAGHVVQGNKDASKAIRDAAVQTGRDALTSAQIGISGGVAGAAGKAVIGQAGAQAVPTLGRIVASGMTAGGAAGLTGSVIQTGTNVAMGEEKRSLGRIVTDTVVQTGVGIVTGGIGARAQAAIRPNTSTAMSVLIRGGSDVVAPTVISVGSNVLTTGKLPTLEEATQQVAIAILGSRMGAKTAQKYSDGTYTQNNWRQNLVSEMQMPNFRSVSDSIGRLFKPKIPPSSQSTPRVIPLEDGNSKPINSTNQQATGSQPNIKDVLASIPLDGKPYVVSENGAKIHVSRSLMEGKIVYDIQNAGQLPVSYKVSITDPTTGKTKMVWRELPNNTTVSLPEGTQIAFGRTPKNSVKLPELTQTEPVQNTAPNQRYQDRSVVAIKDGKIDKGVFIAGEPLVIDFDRSPILQKMYRAAVEQASPGGKFDPSRFPKAVFDQVNKAVPNKSPDAVDKLKVAVGATPDRKISLDVFLENGTGVCRHVSAACGVLLERGIKTGLIKGTVSIDGNIRRTNDPIGHAWCRFTPENNGRAGTPVILDVMHGYLGRLKHNINPNRWSYSRPDEHDSKLGPRPDWNTVPDRLQNWLANNQHKTNPTIYSSPNPIPKGSNLRGDFASKKPGEQFTVGSDSSSGIRVPNIDKTQARVTKLSRGDKTYYAISDGGRSTPSKNGTYYQVKDTDGNLKWVKIPNDGTVVLPSGTKVAFGNSKDLVFDLP